MNEYALTYLSLGAGVQSSALLVCSALGLHGVPKADVAIFADTGDEPQYVYDYLGTLTAWLDGRIPVRTVSRGRLSDSMLVDSAEGRRFVTAPLFTGDGNGMRRMTRAALRGASPEEAK